MVIIRVSDAFTIEQATGDELRAFPFIFSIDNPDIQGETVKKVFVGFSQHLDDVRSIPSNGARISMDGGVTFEQYMKDIPFINVIQKSNGDILSIQYEAYLEHEGDGKSLETFYYVSKDNGETWVKNQGVLYSDVKVETMRFHRGLIELEDGGLLAPIYGKYESDPKYRSLMAKSMDGGVTWRIISVIACDHQLYNHPRFEGFDEPSVVRCADRSLLTVIRVGAYLPLYQCRSLDNGASWSEPLKLPGQPDDHLQSVDPSLVLLPNGILALSYGRPDVKLLISEDGNGWNWTSYTTIYEADKTSGYTGISLVGPDRLLLVGDTGANWQYELNPFPVPNPFSIWGKFIDIVRK